MLNRDIFLKQTKEAFLKNTTLLFLAFCGSGLLAMAASNAECAHVDLEIFGNVIDKWGFGSLGLLVAIIVCGAYLIIGLILAGFGYRDALKYYQEKLVQPFLTPALFQTAGLFMGIYVHLLNSGDYFLWLLFPVSILFFAVIAHSANEII